MKKYVFTSIWGPTGSYLSKFIKLNSFDSVCLFHVPSDKNTLFEAFLVMVGASCQFVVSRLGQNLLSKFTNLDNNILFPIGRPTRTLSSFQLGLRLMVCQNIHSGCRHLWFDLKSGLFCPRLAPTLLCNSTNLNKQLLFPIGSPNCTRSTFPGWVGVGKCVCKETPKSDLDLDLGIVKMLY